MKAGEMAENDDKSKSMKGIAAENDAVRGSRADLVNNDDMEANRRTEGSEIHPDRKLLFIILSLSYNLIEVNTSQVISPPEDMF